MRDDVDEFVERVEARQEVLDFVLGDGVRRERDLGLVVRVFDAFDAFDALDEDRDCEVLM